MRTVKIPFTKKDTDYIYNLAIGEIVTAERKGSAGRKSCIEEAVEYYYRNRVLGSKQRFNNTLVASGRLSKSIKVKKISSEFDKTGMSITQNYSLKMLPSGFINAEEGAIDAKPFADMAVKITNWVKMKEAQGNTFNFNIKKRTRKVGAKSKHRQNKSTREQRIAGKIIGSWLSKGKRMPVFPKWYMLRRNFNSTTKADMDTLKAIIAQRRCIEKTIMRGLK